MSLKYYILGGDDGKKPTEALYEDWQKWNQENAHLSNIAKDEVDDYIVFTKFIGIKDNDVADDLSFFKTKVTQGLKTIETKYTNTWNEAIVAHNIFMAKYEDD